jgi:hypothetical protein
VGDKRVRITFRVLRALALVRPNEILGGRLHCRAKVRAKSEFTVKLRLSRLVRRCPLIPLKLLLELLDLLVEPVKDGLLLLQHVAEQQAIHLAQAVVVRGQIAHLGRSVQLPAELTSFSNKCTLFILRCHPSLDFFSRGSACLLDQIVLIELWWLGLWDLDLGETEILRKRLLRTLRLLALWLLYLWSRVYINKPPRRTLRRKAIAVELLAVHGIYVNVVKLAHCSLLGEAD